MKRKRLIGLLLVVALLCSTMAVMIASAFSEELGYEISNKTDRMERSDYYLKSAIVYKDIGYDNDTNNDRVLQTVTYDYQTITKQRVSAAVTNRIEMADYEETTYETRCYNDSGELYRINKDNSPAANLRNRYIDYTRSENGVFYLSNVYDNGVSQIDTFDPSLDVLLSGKWLFEYDEKGRKIAMQKEDGSEVYEYDYTEDELGRISSKHYTFSIPKDDYQTSGTVYYTYSDDGISHRESYKNEDGSEEYVEMQYDKDGRLIRHSRSLSQGQVTNYEYSYDENGNIDLMTETSENAYGKARAYTRYTYEYHPLKVDHVVVSDDVSADKEYTEAQQSLNAGDDITVAMTDPDPSKIVSAGVLKDNNGNDYYYNEITEPLDASKEQTFAFDLKGSDATGIDEDEPAPANSFKIYNSNTFTEDNLVASVENGEMKDATGTPIVEATVEPENAGGSGMLLMAAPVKATTNGYNVSVKVPANTLKAGNTYYFVFGSDMITNETDANTTNTDIVFKFTTVKAHVHTEKTVPAKEANCTEPGLTEGKVCECGEVLVAQEEIPALGHDFKDGVCTRCGAKDPDYKPDVNNDLDPSVNGIVQCPDGRWAMYKNGKVDTTCTTIAQNKYGWWRVENGYVNFEAQGIYQNKNGWWKTTNGKVTFLEFGLFENENGTWRVENSKVNFKANSIYKGKDGWYKTTNGKVTFDETGVFQNQFGWWYVKNSKVDFDYTGIASNNYGKWYINKGRVDFTKVGFVKVDGKTYTVMFGKVIFG